MNQKRRIFFMLWLLVFTVSLAGGFLIGKISESNVFWVFQLFYIVFCYVLCNRYHL